MRHGDRAVELHDRRRRQRAPARRTAPAMRAQSVVRGGRARARGRRRSPPAARTVRARRRAPRRAASAASPRRISSRSQRARSWSSSRTGSPVGRRARRSARRLDLHQRDEPVHLRLRGHQPGEHAAQAQRLLAQRGPHPVVARRRRVALVEDQVDHLQHRRQARRAARRRAAPRTGTCASRQRALGAHDALRDGRLGDEERARDLGGGQAAEQAQRQRDLRLRRQHRVAGDEDQPQQVVGDRLVDARPSHARHPPRRARLPARAELRLLVLPALCCGAGDRWRDACAVAISQAPGLSGTPDAGQARAPRPARPARAPRPGRRRAPCAPGRR